MSAMFSPVLLLWQEPGPRAALKQQEREECSVILSTALTSYPAPRSGYGAYLKDMTKHVESCQNSSKYSFLQPRLYSPRNPSFLRLLVIVSRIQAYYWQSFLATCQPPNPVKYPSGTA